MLIIGYISQFILYGLIITYSILSPSLFSTFAIAFMMISFVCSIATPYYVVDIGNKRRGSVTPGKDHVYSEREASATQRQMAEEQPTPVHQPKEGEGNE